MSSISSRRRGAASGDLSAGSGTCPPGDGLPRRWRILRTTLARDKFPSAFASPRAPSKSASAIPSVIA